MKYSNWKRKFQTGKFATQILSKAFAHVWLIKTLHQLGSKMDLCSLKPFLQTIHQ
ncbi:Uncharacterised protein [Mycobacteroides abscessus subsp. abscessus]|nr:Uncharacterised protein [Mycobacteroides abscessus subsp. abscessus]